MTTQDEQDLVVGADGRRLDRIELRGLAAQGRHGVHEHERRDGQRFVADVVVHLDTRRAAAGDDLVHTVDYGVLARQVVALLGGEPADLLETLAERIAATVLANPQVEAVDVAVHKPQAPLPLEFDDVVVTIRRDRVKLPAAEPYEAPVADAPAQPAVLPAPTTPHSQHAAPDPVVVEPVVVEPVVPALAPADVTAEGSPVVSDGEQLPTSVDWIPGPGHAEVLPTPPWPRRDGAGDDGPVATEVAAAPVGVPGSPLAALGLVPVPVPAGAPGPAEVLAAAPAAEPASLPPAFAPSAPLVPPPVDSPAIIVSASQPVAAPLPEPAPVAVELDRDSDEVLDRLPSQLVDVVIALGGNLGPVQDTLRWAVQRLRATPGLEVTAVGPLARTAAVGVTDQPDFLNSVVLARSLLPPRELLNRLRAIEQEAGRERHERWGPRTLDLDIIVYGTLAVVTDELELPHPRAHERAFVLLPWAAVEPDAVLPGLGGGPVAALGATAPDTDGLRWVPGDWLAQDGSQVS
ncbi:MAG: 2-amino-4-hydroxy-6-hydroxymethyldihydropteridine diphosphokinase [Actinobacteria bacterium]|nr:2-amino-4-hydroxy-6-hydroxymethyldihydropteridine diphosphokinase [Actinomycetota bacterium]